MMKSTGVVRKCDELGRIVLPIELRKMLGINEKDPVEVFVDGERIVLQKYAPGCTFCGSPSVAKVLNEKLICSSCLTELGK